jgi:hypothetical protein
VPQTDNYGRHEVLHMTRYLMEAIAGELIQHNAIKADPQWLASAKQAFYSLHDLYQAIGRVHLSEESPR